MYVTNMIETHTHWNVLNCFHPVKDKKYKHPYQYYYILAFNRYTQSGIEALFIIL